MTVNELRNTRIILTGLSCGLIATALAILCDLMSTLPDDPVSFPIAPGGDASHGFINSSSIVSIIGWLGLIIWAVCLSCTLLVSIRSQERRSIGRQAILWKTLFHLTAIALIVLMTTTLIIIIRAYASYLPATWANYSEWQAFAAQVFASFSTFISSLHDGYHDSFTGNLTICLTLELIAIGMLIPTICTSRHWIPRKRGRHERLR